MYLFELVFLFSSDKCPGMELLDYLIIQFFIFWENSILFSTEIVSIYIFINVYESSLSWTSSVTLVIFYLFDNSYSNSVRSYLIVVFTCISLMISDGEHFLYVFWPPVCFLWKMSLQTICAVLYLVAQSCSTAAHQALVWFFSIKLFSFPSTFD